MVGKPMETPEARRTVTRSKVLTPDGSQPRGLPMAG
jgi:hypothetical protein